MSISTTNFEWLVSTSHVCIQNGGPGIVSKSFVMSQIMFLAPPLQIRILVSTGKIDTVNTECEQPHRVKLCAYISVLSETHPVNWRNKKRDTVWTGGGF